MSKILFIGDSFTWGQGLYFYKWIKERKKFPPNTIGGSWHTHEEFITEDDLKYKDALSYTKLVSDYYNCEPIKIQTNGGSNTEHIFDMMKLIDEHRDSISKLVFQFTALSRYHWRDLNLNFDKDYYGSFDSLYYKRCGEFFNYIDSILKYYSTIYDFEYCYLDWLGDSYPHSDTKFVKYEVDDKTYYNFNEFLEKYKLDLMIDGTHIVDLHLNKEGQKILSNSIISHFGQH
jgi:hypothetical protein